MTEEKTKLTVRIANESYSYIEVTGTDLADVIVKAKTLNGEFTGKNDGKPVSVPEKKVRAVSPMPHSLDASVKNPQNKKDFVPKCPDCGESMIKRKGSRGSFWGCGGYPGCHGTRQVKD